MSARTSLLPIVRKYFEDDPLAAAHSLEAMSVEEAINVLKALPPTLSAQAFPYLQAGYAAALLNEIPEELCKNIVEKLDPQQGVYLFFNFPSSNRKKFLDNLPEKIKHQIHELLIYPENSAGRIMMTDLLSFHTDIKVKDAIQKSARWPGGKHRPLTLMSLIKTITWSAS